MKICLLLLTFCLLPFSALADQCGNGGQTPNGRGALEIILKKSKIAFDAGMPDMQGLTACREPGYSCRSSLDCCGSSFCRDGVCGDSGNSCRGPGAACRGSLDCCGSSFCRDGYCSDNGNSCRQEGAKCKGSLDCCGSNFCRDGFCQ